MLHHHSDKDYNVAASEAAHEARTVMEKKISEGRVSALALLDRVNTQVPKDQLVKAHAFEFLADSEPGTPGLQLVVKDEASRVHRHALTQMAGKAGIPSAYLAGLVDSGDQWQRDLAAHILDSHLTIGQPESRFLLRSVKGEVRGFLSDRYRRLDSRPLLEAFADACKLVGAVPVDGVVSDTRLALKAFLPMVFEPVPNEVMCLGIEWGNSDFGAARHTVRAMIWRLWCTNKATMEDTMSQVHLGGRLSDDIAFSDKTYRLDTAASVSALRDVVSGLLGPDKVNTLLQTIKQANEKKIDWKDLKSTIAKKLLKSELAAVEAAYQSEDVINLPAGQSVWRASNAVSWIAGKTESPDRRLELERIAGEVMNGKRDTAVDAEAA